MPAGQFLLERQLTGLTDVMMQHEDRITRAARKQMQAPARNRDG